MRRTIHDLAPRPQQSTAVGLAFICPTPLLSAARPQRAFIQGFERASPRVGVSGPHPLGGCDVGEARASSGSPDPAVPRRRGPGPRAVHGAGAAPAHGAAGHARAGDVTAGPRSGGGARPAAVAADHRDARRSQRPCSRGGIVPRTSASAWVVAGMLAPGRGRRGFCGDGVREATGDDEAPVASASVRSCHRM